MGVGQRRETHDVGFADLLQKIGDHLVKLVVPDLDAIRMADGLDLQFAVGLLGGDFERRAGFSMRLAAGLSCTGTFRCISTLAAADEEMGLTGCAGSAGTGAAAGRGLGAEGMTIFSEHEGQVISVPAPVLSTANSCSHFGQLKMMSIAPRKF